MQKGKSYISEETVPVKHKYQKKPKSEAPALELWYKFNKDTNGESSSDNRGFDSSKGIVSASSHPPPHSLLPYCIHPFSPSPPSKQTLF